jgi:hypothetical protein
VSILFAHLTPLFLSCLHVSQLNPTALPPHLIMTAMRELRRAPSTPFLGERDRSCVTSRSFLISWRRLIPSHMSMVHGAVGSIGAAGGFCGTAG